MAQPSEKEIKVFLKRWGLYSSYLRHQDCFDHAAETAYCKLEQIYKRKPNEDECTELLAKGLKRLAPWIRLSVLKGLDNVPVFISDTVRESFARFVVMRRYPSLKQTP